MSRNKAIDYLIGRFVETRNYTVDWHKGKDIRRQNERTLSTFKGNKRFMLVIALRFIHFHLKRMRYLYQNVQNRLNLTICRLPTKCFLRLLTKQPAVSLEFDQVPPVAAVQAVDGN